MKILQLSGDSFYPSVGGNATVMANFAKLIKFTGNESLLINDNKRNVPCYYKVDNTTVFNPCGPDEIVVASIESIALAEEVDLILCHDGDYPRHLKALALDSLKHIKKVVIHHYFKPRIMVEADLTIFDAIIVFQQAHKEKYVKDYGIDQYRVFYVNHVIDEAFSFDERKPRTNKSICYVGRLAETKGIERVLLVAKCLNRHFKILGPDHFKSEGIRDALLMATKEIGIGSMEVRNYKPAEAANVFGRFGIYLLDSSSECYSLSAAEAMACGARVVAQNNPMAFEWAKPYITLYEPGESVVDVVKNLEDNYDRKTIAHHSRTMHSLESAVPLFKKMLISVMANRTKEKEPDPEVQFRSSYLRYKANQDKSGDL